MNPKKPHHSKILIAEDDAVSRRMLQSFLSKWGYGVVAVGNGRDALRILEQEDAPPIAILDWMMPELEGPEVCRELRRHSDRNYIYALLLTARTEKEDLLRGLESGADDYLTKPFDTMELRARLHVGQRILDLQQNLLKATAELRFRATHDMLTGVHNRASVLDTLNRESSRQQRDGGCFGVILADLDHFKEVNDTHGHLAGDAVLKEAARRMKTGVRPYDTVGRYGGEEFLIVAPSGDAKGTLALAERVRKNLETSPIKVEAGVIPVTLSLGIAVSTAAEPVDPNELLRMADDALYGAKSSGRNRAQVYERGSANITAAKELPVAEGQG